MINIWDFIKCMEIAVNNGEHAMQLNFINLIE